MTGEGPEGAQRGVAERSPGQRPRAAQRPARAPWLRLALREIRNHPRFAAFFSLNLALGLSGFVALDAFETSVTAQLQARSRAFLGADVVVGSTRALAPEEVARLDALAGEGAVASRAVQLYSMAGTPGRARLVELRAVDERFPLYGAIELEGNGVAGAPEREALAREPGAWVDPALLMQLGVRPGAELRVGHSSFRILHSVARDSGRPTSGFSIAPRVYLALARLPATGLVTTGSRVQHQRFYRLAEGADPDAVAAQLRRAGGDARLSVQSHGEATRSLARAYESVARFLGLVSMGAVFLAGIGAAYLFRASLGRRLRDVAILQSLGASPAQAQGVFLLQLWLLALAAALLACALGALLLPALARSAAELLPAELGLRVGPRTVAVATALALGGSVAACLPFLVRLRRLRPGDLFREHARPSLERGPGDLLLLLPALLLFWGVAVLRAGDVRAGSVFAGIFGASAAALAALGFGGLSALARLPARLPLAARLALRQLARSRGSSAAGFLALSLCALLVTLAPQLQSLLERELDPPEGARLPSLFLFDIQPEQVEALSAHVAARGSQLQRIAPMVRARLDAINGAAVQGGGGDEAGAAQGSEPGEEGRRLRSRRYNLTYAPAPSDAETLVAGLAWGERALPGEIPEISLEVEFAEALGVGLGDVLAFDVQGVPVEGRITSLREVRWNSFQPNFFVAFQPGVLEEAPKIFLASVPRLPAGEREALQASIAEAFPNVSAVDVTLAVQRLLALLSQLHWAIASTALLSLVVGLVLVLAIARDQAHARRWETNLLKVLGAELREIRASLDIEFGALGLLAALAGAAAGLLASALLARAVLHVDWTPAWPPLAATVALIPALCVLAARGAARGVLRERPLLLLQAPET